MSLTEHRRACSTQSHGLGAAAANGAASRQSACAEARDQVGLAGVVLGIAGPSVCQAWGIEAQLATAGIHWRRLNCSACLISPGGCLRKMREKARRGIPETRPPVLLLPSPPSLRTPASKRRVFSYRSVESHFHLNLRLPLTTPSIPPPQRPASPAQWTNTHIRNHGAPTDEVAGRLRGAAG